MLQPIKRQEIIFKHIIQIKFKAMAKKTSTSTPVSIPKNIPAGDLHVKGGVPTMQNPPKPPPQKK